MRTALALALLCAAPAVEQAKGHLKAGRIDEVYFALEKQQLDEADRPEAAKVLADAARKALDKKDAVMALQLSKMADQVQPGLVAGLEVSSRASRALEQFADAEAYADQWLAAEPESADAHLWRAELALDAGDWEPALAHLDQVKGKGPAAAKARALRDRAQKEQVQRKSGLSTLKQLERELARAQAERANAPPEPEAVALAEAKTEDVIVYSTTWCGFCRKAKAYLQKKGVPFTEKDVEKDPEAAVELAKKAARARVKVDGVPVIDFKGTLVLGFDQQQLARLIGG